MLRGDFNRLGHLAGLCRASTIGTMRCNTEGVDKNFAIRFPWLDRLFGTHLLAGKWPSGYGVPEAAPKGHRARSLYPFRRRKPA